MFWPQQLKSNHVRGIYWRGWEKQEDQPGLTLKTTHSDLLPLIPAPGKQKQKDLSEFKASLADVVSFKPVGATYWYLLSEKRHKVLYLFTLLKCIQVAELVKF